jgi:predicted phage gp36 major capsid-like protein
MLDYDYWCSNCEESADGPTCSKCGASTADLCRGREEILERYAQLGLAARGMYTILKALKGSMLAKSIATSPKETIEWALAEYEALLPKKS